jgi:RNA 2',3'-cyclic 3'-phosphodiesterase
LKRLFFALWPDDVTRQRCVSIINSISPKPDKTVDTANLHVTLLFLGNISKIQQTSLQAAASSIAIPEMTIYFNRLSFWKKAGILCLTVAKPYTELQYLAENLKMVARELNIKTDDRPYTPHITLVRDAKQLAPIEFEPIIWRSHSFCLVQSHSLNHKTAYEIIKEWPPSPVSRQQ